MSAEDLASVWQSLTLHLMTKAADISRDRPELADAIRLKLSTFLDKSIPSTTVEMSNRVVESSQMLIGWRLLS
jgi:hypothetical protein